MTDDAQRDALVESEFFWYSLKEGDLIMLEADYYQDGKLLLQQNLAYEILAKLEPSVSNISFVVQSEQTGELVSVHPFLIGDYLLNPFEHTVN